jgi:DNA-binding NarL/FixJ family response regulator
LPLRAAARGSGALPLLPPGAGDNHTLAACNTLTPRQSDVLGPLAHGLAGKQIARRLAISPLTVDAHLRSLYGKCGVTSHEELFGRLI